MNGRFFAGQQLLADFWDGVTNFATGLEGCGPKEDDEVGGGARDSHRFCCERVILRRMRRRGSGRLLGGWMTSKMPSATESDSKPNRWWQL